MSRPRHVRLVALALPAAIVVTLLATGRSTPLAPTGQVRGAVAPPAPSLLVEDQAPVVAHSAARAMATDPDALSSVTWRPPADPSTLTGYRWPLLRGRITLPFKAIPGGTRINRGSLWHDGVDMATFCGDSVRAAHDGVVLAAGRHFDDVIGWVGDLSRYYALLDRRNMWKDLPLVVVIDDGNGYRSIYAHFGKVAVRTGTVVHAGQLIGYEGATGHASGCHVHYGLFSPHETKTFGVRPDILRNLRLPKFEIARIDPLLVLPGGAEALRKRQVPPPTKPVAPRTASARMPAN